MSQKNRTAGSPKRKREAIQEDLRALEETLHHSKAVDGKPAVVSANALLDIKGVDAQGNPIFASAQQQPAPTPWDAITNSWLGHGLRRCVEENRPDAAQALLGILLGKACAGMVDAKAFRAFEAEVFKDFPQTGGPPVSKESDRIYKCWLENGKPSLRSHTLAWRYYGARFERANASERRRLCNQCRAAVMRAQGAEIAKMARDTEDIFP